QLDGLRERPRPVDRHPPQDSGIEVVPDPSERRVDLLPPGVATKHAQPERVYQLKLMELRKRDRLAGAAHEACHALGLRLRNVERDQHARSYPATTSPPLCPSLDHDLTRGFPARTPAPDRARPPRPAPG